MAAISWKSGVSGDWTTKADWSGGVVPGSGDDVTVAAAGTYTVTISTADAARSLTVNDATATVADNSALTIWTTLKLTAGTFQLNGGGTIAGGTLSATGGNFAWNGPGDPGNLLGDPAGRAGRAPRATRSRLRQSIRRLS